MITLPAPHMLALITQIPPPTHQLLQKPQVQHMPLLIVSVLVHLDSQLPMLLLALIHHIGLLPRYPLLLSHHQLLSFVIPNLRMSQPQNLWINQMRALPTPATLLHVHITGPQATPGDTHQPLPPPTRTRTPQTQMFLWKSPQLQLSPLIQTHTLLGFLPV